MSNEVELLVRKVIDKKTLAEKLAKAFDMQPLSIWSNWLNTFYAIPKGKRKKAIKIIETYIKNQE